MYRQGAGILVLSAAMALLAGCAAAAPPSSPANAVTSTPTPTPQADPTAAQAIAPTAAGWWAGTRVTLTAASYDPDSREVTVSLSADNTANTDSFTDTESITLDVGSGAPLRVATASSIAVASSTTDVDLSFTAPDAGLDLAAAILQLGGPGEKHWLLPLDPGAVATGEEPRTFPVTGLLDAGGLTFTVDHVDVLPWVCTDSDDYGPGGSGRISYGVGAEGESALVLWGDVLENASIYGGDALDSATLLRPDGKTSPQIGSILTVFDLAENIEDYGLCFTVEDPTAGDYTLTWTSYRGATATFGFTLQ